MQGSKPYNLCNDMNHTYFKIFHVPKLHYVIHCFSDFLAHGWLWKWPLNFRMSKRTFHCGKFLKQSHWAKRKRHPSSKHRRQASIDTGFSAGTHSRQSAGAAANPWDYENKKLPSLYQRYLKELLKVLSPLSREALSKNFSGLWEPAPHGCFSVRLHGVLVPSSCEIK